MMPARSGDVQDCLDKLAAELSTQGKLMTELVQVVSIQAGIISALDDTAKRVMAKELQRLKDENDGVSVVIEGLLKNFAPVARPDLRVVPDKPGDDPNSP